MNRRQALKAIAAGIGTATALTMRGEDNAPPVAVTRDPYKEIYRYDAAYRAAIADASTLDPQVAYCSRYIAFSGIHPDDYFTLAQGVLFVYNSLSKNVLPLPAIPVDNGRVLRINLKDAYIDPAAWERMGLHGSGPLKIANPNKDFPEPYWHVVEQALVYNKAYCDPYKAKDGNTYNYTWEQKLAKVVKYAEHLNQQDVAKLAKLTHTDFPVVRADWFVATALFGPAYYDLLGAGKDLNSLRKVARYHKEDNVDLEMAGTVIDSTEVALNNRTLLRGKTALGYWYESFDYLTSTDENDLLLNVLLAKKGRKVKNKVQFRDAGEFIFSLPNGLQGYGITNADDKLIDKGDTGVVVDRRTHFKYKDVFNAYSCVSCHDQGLKPVADEVRIVTDIRKNVQLLTLDPHDADIVFQLFQQNFDTNLIDDKSLYGRKLFEVNGMSPKDNADNITRIVVNYYQEQIGIKEAAVECCYSPEHTRKALALGIGVDPRLPNALEGRGIRRDNWEATAFHHAIKLCQMLDNEQKAGKTFDQLWQVRQAQLKARQQKTQQQRPQQK